MSKMKDLYKGKYVVKSWIKTIVKNKYIIFRVKGNYFAVLQGSLPHTTLFNLRNHLEKGVIWKQ